MKTILVILVIALAFVSGGFLQEKLHKNQSSDPQTYDEIMLKWPNKPDIRGLRKQIILNKAQGTILEELMKDELKKK